MKARPMNDTTADLEQRALHGFKLWFFRDLSDDQRIGLFRLALGDGIAREATNHGLQRHALRALFAAFRDAERVAEGAGLVLVPREPTEDMVEAAIDTALAADEPVIEAGLHQAVWTAMLAAAPTPQPGSATDAGQANVEWWAAVYHTPDATKAAFWDKAEDLAKAYGYTSLMAALKALTPASNAGGEQ